VQPVKLVLYAAQLESRGETSLLEGYSILFHLKPPWPLIAHELFEYVWFMNATNDQLLGAHIHTGN
jgi:hypothetical protein